MLNASRYRRTAAVALFFALCVVICSACSQMASQYGFKPSVRYDIRGKVQDGVYSSIDGTYQISVPPLLEPGAVIKDQRSSNNVTMLSMTDDLCREFLVVETPVSPRETFDVYAESILNSWAARLRGTIVERKKIDTSFGSALFSRMKIPEGSPCVQVTFVDGKRKDERPDAEAALLFVPSGGRIYHFHYVLGPLGDGFVIKTGPVKEVLMEFVGGFKQLK